MAENEHKPERVPEKASRSMLEVPIGAKRNQLDIEKDTWYAVAELAKGKTYREIAQELSEKNGYSRRHSRTTSHSSSNSCNVQ